MTASPSEMSLGQALAMEASKYTVNSPQGIMTCIDNGIAGLMPPLSVSASLLGFAILKAVTTLMQWRGYAMRPFTPQENTVVQTCAVAGASIVLSSGLGSAIPGVLRVCLLHCTVGKGPLGGAYAHLETMQSASASAHQRILANALSSILCVKCSVCTS